MKFKFAPQWPKNRLYSMMALGSSIFLPCNHSGAFIIVYNFESAHAFNNRTNKIYAYEKVEIFLRCLTFLIAIVSMLNGCA